MTNEEITQYNWHSFLQGDKVYMRPENDKECIELNKKYGQYTFPGIYIGSGKVYAGSELEQAEQYYFKREWFTINFGWQKDFAIREKCKTRQVLRLKSSIADTEKPKEYRYTIDGKPCTEKQYLDTKFASCFIEVGNPEKHEVNHPVETVEQETLAQAVDKLLQKGSLKRDERAQSIYYMGAQFGYKFAKNEPLTLKQIQGVLESIIERFPFMQDYLTETGNRIVIDMAQDIYNKQFER